VGLGASGTFQASTNDDKELPIMTNAENASEPKALPPPRRRLEVSRGAAAAGAVAVVLIAGAALGAGGTRLAQNWQPRSVMLLQPAPIEKMAERSPVAIKGDVAEIFGNKFVVQDASGRTLVDTGPRGENRMVVAKGETVTVQGRFDRGVVHADVLAHADGRNEAFGPPDHGPKGPKGPKDGPGARADRGPPPPPPADRDGPDDGAPPSPPR
jgi:uncharacterized protein YdeI (BOF family)